MRDFIYWFNTINISDCAKFWWTHCTAARPHSQHPASSRGPEGDSVQERAPFSAPPTLFPDVTAALSLWGVILSW
jgi:hypothetical protein